ncbi:unnamed protein product [Closterium sp. NIES-65]|nr:unnamed protein product [Closterium sp. NIES-65]
MEDPPLPADKGKEKVVEEDAAVTIHTEGSSSGLSLEEKLAALTSAHADADDFTDDDSDDELEFDVTKDLVAKQRFTAILLIPFILQQEMANVILTDLFPAYVAKTKYSRLQLSFLKEEDAVNVRQATLEYQRANSSVTHKLHWLHAENAAFIRFKASNARALEVLFKGVPANITPEGLEEMLTKHKLKIRQVTPFLEGHCFHRVLHPVSGADTDVIKGLVIPHTEEKKRRHIHQISHPLEHGKKLLVHQESTRIDRALVSQSLLPRLISASHVKPEEPVSDHDFAIRIAFKIKSQLRTGPGLWRMHPSMLHRPGVRKLTEEVEGQVAQKGGDFEVLISRLNISLRRYSKEESKRIRATINHLSSMVAGLAQEFMCNPKDQLLKERLRKAERQLKEYHACRRERNHLMAGMAKELVGEIPSPHLSARIKMRRVKTQITELAVPGGVVTEPKEILKAASEYYSGLFGEDKRTALSNWVPAAGKRLWFSEAECLQEDWTEAEVKRALKEMADNKSPGKDGLPKELFEQHWDVLGKHLKELVQSFTSSSSLPTSVKDAVTILLHKKGAKEQLENYRPITLLNFSYKVLARVLASRIKKVLHKVISEEQFGFIPGRRVSDAVGLVADVIDAAKNGMEDWYMLLVDFRKAFDSVSRDFTFEVLKKMGFPERFVGWVKGLHDNTRTSLLVNGWMGEAVDVVSGVRQGCPIAPYLFLCAVEPLVQLVEKKKLGITIRGCTEQRLAYVGYADDTTLLLQGKQQIVKAEEVLEEFKNISGLATNKDKSVVLPLGVNLGKKTWRTDGFRWAGADEAEKLLGIWVTPSGSCQPTWDKALERIVGKMSLWQPQYLPIKARRAVMDGYIMPIAWSQAQVYPPPARTWGVITKLSHTFMSANKVTTEKCFFLWSKELLYTPVLEGGVGAKDPEAMLTCFTARRIGLILNESSQLKRNLLRQAADLPLGLDTFMSHEKLLKVWEGKSQRWKLACENFMRSPLAVTGAERSKEEVGLERIVFNRHILRKGSTPFGGQKAAKRLREVRLGDLIRKDEEGRGTLKDLVTLERELLGMEAAKLALEAFATAPEAWRGLLLSAELPQMGFAEVYVAGREGSKQLRNKLLVKGEVAPMKSLRSCWGHGSSGQSRRKKWEDRWSGRIDWKRAVKTRESLVTLSRPRDVLLRIHSLNLQVGERLPFLSSGPVCPFCGVFETLEHCFSECPKIRVVVAAVKKALRMINPGRRAESLGDWLFGKANSTSAFPEATLISIALHQLWVERCEGAFRGCKFRTRRVLRRIETALRMHVNIYVRASAGKLQQKGKVQQARWHVMTNQEQCLLNRIRVVEGKGWRWSAKFAAIWGKPHRPRIHM